MQSEPIPMNVSKQADEAFVQEIKNGDPARYQRLMKARGSSDTLDKWAVGVCAECSGTVGNAPFIERGKETGNGLEYCSRACRAGSSAEVHPLKAGRPRLTIKQQKQSSIRRQESQRDLMRNRRSLALAKNCQQPIENTVS